MTRLFQKTLIALAALAGPLLTASPTHAQRPTAPEQTYPFTNEQNVDGARYVWFIFSRAGFAYPYTAAKTFPPRNQFREVTAQAAQQADVVWWPTLMGGYSGPADRRVQVADGSLSLDSLILVKGQPKFYRKQMAGTAAPRGGRPGRASTRGGQP